MKRTLFQLTSENVKMEITACFEKGELLIEGHDTGPQVQQCWGDMEYEYTMVLPEEGVAELRHILNLNPFARKDLLEILALRFCDIDCYADLKKFLGKQGIAFKEYSWVG